MIKQIESGGADWGAERDQDALFLARLRRQKKSPALARARTGEGVDESAELQRHCDGVRHQGGTLYGLPTAKPRPFVDMYTTPKVFMSPTMILPSAPYWCASSLMRNQVLPTSVERNRPRTPPTVAKM